MTLEGARALTDLGNAELFAELHGDVFRYVRQQRAWHHYRRGRWRRCETGEPERAAKEVVRERIRRAAKVDGEEQKTALKWALRSQSAHQIHACLDLASTEDPIAARASDFDRHPFLLATPNGTIDLETGELRASRADDLLTHGTEVEYDPDAKAPRWERFLEEVFDGDRDLIAFMRKASGYCLTGSTSEQVLFLLHGTGGNGKGTYIETFKKVLGDLATTANFDSFARSRGDRGPRNDLARLHRSRLVVASESNESRRLDEAMVKNLTGGDTITARYLYAEDFEYRPEFKLWLVTNHLPKVDGSDPALWRRLRTVPFQQSFIGTEDPTLPEQLDAELVGILAWAVRGCLEWQREGLGQAEAVRRATAEYRQEEDVLGAFLLEHEDPTGEVAAADLREAFATHLNGVGERPPNAASFGRKLASRGVQSRQSNGVRFYRGYRL